jgi:hypothetical protein
VKDGLSVNQLIVTDGIQKLKEGAVVSLASDSTKNKNVDSSMHQPGK